MKKAVFSFLLLLVAAMSLSALTASANSPAPPTYFDYTVINAEENVKFADVLIKIAPGDADYAYFNRDNPVSEMVEVNSKIVTYHEDGYRSMSFHYAYAVSSLQLQGAIKIINSLPINDITPSIKIALLDADGNILKISPEISVIPDSYQLSPRAVRYDAVSDTLEVQFVKDSFYGGPYMSIWFSFTVLFQMALSILCEALIALAFRLRPVYKIILVNIVTQVAFVSCILWGGFDYLTVLIVGESVIYVAEFLAYLLLLREQPKWRLAVYTVVANTASLLLGYFLNSFGVLNL